MEPHDDPEARIRALEQPLADNARATELGTTPYTAPNHAYLPPPLPPMPPQAQGRYPPPGYGAPWAPPPRKSSAGIPWVIFAVAAVLFLVVAAADPEHPRRQHPEHSVHAEHAVDAEHALAADRCPARRADQRRRCRHQD